MQGKQETQRSYSRGVQTVGVFILFLDRRHFGTISLRTVRGTCYSNRLINCDLGNAHRKSPRRDSSSTAFYRARRRQRR